MIDPSQIPPSSAVARAAPDTPEGRVARTEGALQLDAVVFPVGRRLAPWLGAAVGVAVFLYVFSGVLTPFVAGIALGYLLDPTVERLERLGLNRLGAALLILAFFLVILVLGLLLVAPVLGHQLANFVEAAPRIVSRLQALVSDSSGKLVNTWAGDLLQQYGLSPGPDSAAELQKTLGDLVGEGARWGLALAKSLVSGGAALLGLVSLLVVTPVVAFYILVDWPRMIASLESLVPPRVRPQAAVLAAGVDKALAGFVRGQSLVCLFLGLWYGIGLSLIGLNFGFLIGVTAGFLSFIPYVGSLSALVVGSIVAVVQGWPDWRLLAMVWAVVLSGQFLEGNFLSPKLVGESVGLHPVWLMFALLAGGSLFGFTGLIVAVPAAAALGVLLRFALAQYRETPFYRESAQTAGVAPQTVDDPRP